MARRPKPKTITDVVSFGEDMSLVSKLLIRNHDNLYTGGEHYRLLNDLHIRLSEVTLAISGEHELPWVAWSRGGNWPSSGR
jgi:hypothetical protein